MEKKKLCLISAPSQNHCPMWSPGIHEPLALPSPLSLAHWEKHTLWDKEMLCPTGKPLWQIQTKSNKL